MQSNVPSSDEVRNQLLRHFLAALAYRTQKALRGAPEEFATFDAGRGARTPIVLVRHMESVLGYARTFYIGGTHHPEPLENFNAEIDRFHETLTDLSAHLKKDSSLNGITHEQLLQGPLSDAMTHAGQLAMLRRLAGDAVAPENFVFAEIDPANTGADQPAPARPGNRNSEW